MGMSDARGDMVLETSNHYTSYKLIEWAMSQGFSAREVKLNLFGSQHGVRIVWGYEPPYGYWVYGEINPDGSLEEKKTPEEIAVLYASSLNADTANSVISPLAVPVKKWWEFWR